MADYYQLMVRAFAGLGKNSDETWRSALYARARGALVIELCRITPPLSEPEITRECLLFEEAIRKIEANLTHRPLSAAVVPALLPPVEHPQQESLLLEQGGLPVSGRESSPEAYMPGGSIRYFGSPEPLSETQDQCFPPCPIAAPVSEVEPTSDIAMGEGINGYTLEKLVADFPYGSLWEFHDFEYEACRKDFGLERKFSGEVFYRAANNVFLGRASTPAIVGSLDGKVYKIYFAFMHRTEEDCREFLRSVSHHLGTKYGVPSGLREINREQKMVCWDRSFGNVSLETDLFWCRNAIIYTSSVVRPKRRAWLGRMLDR